MDKFLCASLFPHTLLAQGAIQKISVILVNLGIEILLQYARLV